MILVSTFSYILEKSFKKTLFWALRILYFAVMPILNCHTFTCLFSASLAKYITTYSEILWSLSKSSWIYGTSYSFSYNVMVVFGEWFLQIEHATTIIIKISLCMPLDNIYPITLKEKWNCKDRFVLLSNFRMTIVISRPYRKYTLSFNRSCSLKEQP